MYPNTWIRWGMVVVLFIGITSFTFAEQTSKTEESGGTTSTQIVGPGMMGSMMGPMMGTKMIDFNDRSAQCALAERPLLSFLLQHKAELKLTAEQIEKLEALRTDFRTEAIQRWSDLQVAALELDTLLRKEPVDLAQVEAKTKQIAALQAEGHFARIKTLEQGKAILSPEQRAELETFRRTGKTMLGASDSHMMSQHGMGRMMNMMGQMGTMMGSQRGMMSPLREHMTW